MGSETGGAGPAKQGPMARQATCDDDGAATGIRLALLLERAHELASGQLEGIDEAALELADVAGPDRRVVERALRLVADRARMAPSHANKQVAALIRRSVELGMARWEWDETEPVP